MNFTIKFPDMNISRSLVLFSFIMIACMPEKEPPLVELSTNINNLISKTNGTFAVAFEDLKTGDTLYFNARERFHAASTMKTPVMIELYKQAYEGIFSLEDPVLVKTEFSSIVDGSAYEMDISDDSENILYEKVGSMIPMKQLIYEMITKSSNLATNILIEVADAKKVTSSMRDLGAPDIEVLRGVEDIKAYEKGLSNTTTAYDLMKIYEAIGKEEIISAEVCAEMTNILLDQQFNEIIPALLPDDVKVAHKTGSITGVQHDSGIIILPNGHKYILILLSKDLESREKGIETLSQISKLVYAYVVSEKDEY
jgi:beta-lactamase class A